MFISELKRYIENLPDDLEVTVCTYRDTSEGYVRIYETATRIEIAENFISLAGDSVDRQ